MTYEMEDYPEELLNKMKQWGIIKEQDETVCIPTGVTAKRLSTIAKKHQIPTFCSDIAFAANQKNLNWFHFSKLLFNQALMITTSGEVNLKTKVKQLETRCELITQKLQELEKRQGIRKEPTLSEIIYEEHKSELESERFGKIIAIDNAKKEVVGVGDTVLEAYYDAKEHSKNEKFSYIRVGYTDRL